MVWSRANTEDEPFHSFEATCQRYKTVFLLSQPWQTRSHQFYFPFPLFLTPKQCSFVFFPLPQFVELLHPNILIKSLSPPTVFVSVRLVCCPDPWKSYAELSRMTAAGTQEVGKRLDMKYLLFYHNTSKALDYKAKGVLERYCGIYPGPRSALFITDSFSHTDLSCSLLPVQPGRKYCHTLLICTKLVLIPAGHLDRRSLGWGGCTRQITAAMMENWFLRHDKIPGVQIGTWAACKFRWLNQA